MKLSLDKAKSVAARQGFRHGGGDSDVIDHPFFTANRMMVALLGVACLMMAGAVGWGLFH